MTIVSSSSIVTLRIVLRTPCRMSESLTPCFRAGAPIRTKNVSEKGSLVGRRGGCGLPGSSSWGGRESSGHQPDHRPFDHRF